MSFRLRSARTAWILLLSVAVAALYLNGRVRTLEEDLRAAELRGDAATAKTRRLEEELHSEMEQKDAMAQAVREAVEERDRREQEREERLREASRPMPEGVRQALITVQDCLREDGHQGLRLLRASAILDRSLRDVELIHYDQSQLISAVYMVGRMELVLDRSSSILTLRMFDGHRLLQGERESFPEDGFDLLVPGVDGPKWESRLPFLLQAVEAYPEEEDATPVKSLDPITRRDWQERLDRLLDEADTVENMRIGSIESLEGGVFGGVLLLGYDDRSLLVMSANAARVVVRVDEAADVVQLILRDGVLRKVGGETAIDQAGYRILLPGVTPRRARDIMMGMVAER